MKKKKQTPLWSITPPNGPVSYIFGTLHAPDARAFSWIEPATERLLSCTCFAGEFDLSEINSAVLEAGIRLPEGQTLKGLLPRGAWNQLEFLADRRLGTHAQALDGLHPFVVWSMLMKSNLTGDYDSSPDEMMWQTAMHAGKQVAGMESYSGQIDIVRRIPMESHVSGLVRYLKHYRKAGRQTDRMLSLYEAGQIQELARIARQSLRENRNILSDQRNINMAARFEALSSEQSLFCAVGVAHLGGSAGLLRLLKHRGMCVKPDEKSLVLFRR